MQQDRKLMHSEANSFDTEGLQYIVGTNTEGQCVQSIQQCCGNIIGCCKGWVPCIGCFCCCCPEPYVTIPQGSKGLLTRYARYIGTLSPGLVFINPLTQNIEKIDCRISVVDLPEQHLMTKDNISIRIDSCVYYHIERPHLMNYRLQNFNTAIQKVCGGILKNTMAEFTFQELLESREIVEKDISEQVQPIISHWGFEIDKIYLKDFKINAQLQKELVSASVARREAQSTIIQAKGDVEVAKLLANRSKILDSRTAIQVRYLETLKSLADHPSSRMIYRSC